MATLRFRQKITGSIAIFVRHSHPAGHPFRAWTELSQNMVIKQLGICLGYLIITIYQLFAGLWTADERNCGQKRSQTQGNPFDLV